MKSLQFEHPMTRSTTQPAEDIWTQEQRANTLPHQKERFVPNRAKAKNSENFGTPAQILLAPFV